MWHWNNIEIRLFQCPVFPGYLFERQYRPVYEHQVPYVKRIPLLSIYKSGSSYWKLTLEINSYLNFVNININNWLFHPFLPDVPKLHPLDTIEDLMFSNVYKVCKSGTLGWNELKSLTCFFSMFPFYTPWKHQKTKGYFDKFKRYEIRILWKSVKQSFSWYQSKNPLLVNCSKY